MKFKATTFIVTIGLLLFNASCVSKNNSSSDINISSSFDLIYTTSTLESSIVAVQLQNLHQEKKYLYI